VGGIHGPVHAGIPRGALGFLHDTALVHPQAHTIREAIERAREARGGHKNGHNQEKQVQTQSASEPAKQLKGFEMDWSGRVDSNHRPPGPEACGIGYLYEYKVNIFV
jgi:hypothetical protein